MSRQITAGETDPDLLKVYFQIVDVTDGMTPETGEGTGQPQISIDGAAWTNTGIGTLTHIGNGRYYASLDASIVATGPKIIETRYKSANTAECPGDTIEVTAPYGDGARAVTITVEDEDSNVIENANVRVTKSAKSFTRLTNASGVSAFSLDDGTWVVSITLDGYDFTPVNLVVDGTEAVTYTLTTVAIPASDPGQVTGYIYCYDEAGDPVAGATVSIQQLKPGTGTGYAFDNTVRVGTSDIAGLISFTGLFVGATYKIWRGNNVIGAKEFRVDSTDTSPMALDNILGN